MKNISLLMGLLLVSNLAFSDSMPQECAAFSDKAIIVNMTDLPTQIDSTQSIVELNTLFNKSLNRSIANVIIAITQSDFRYDRLYGVDGIQLSSGFCAILTGTIALQATIIIHMPSELSKSSCAYREVMIHEQKHVSFKEAQHANIRNKIAELVKNSSSSPVMYANVGEADKALQSLSEKLSSEIESIAKLELSRNHGLDTRSEYNRVHDICPDEFISLYLTMH